MKRSVIALILATALSVTALPYISAHSAGTVHETTVTETEYGEINNLVSRKETVDGAETSISTAGTVTASNGGYYTGAIYADSGERAAYIVDAEGELLDSSVSLTVRYSHIGFYYPGRKTLDDGTTPINIGAEVTISNPSNLVTVALFENFWYGGHIKAVSGRPGGRADYSISFFNTDTGEAVLLGDDAWLVASSLDGWPIAPKISYEGISFCNAEETWVTYRSDGNITTDSGDLFGVPSYYTGERKAAYEDIKDHKTFINCGVSFRQNSTTWKCAFVTQTDHEEGHGDWFYFSATPTNLIRPAEPEKTSDQAVYHVGDTVTYSISQKVSRTPDEGYGSYGSFQFIDRLPAGLDYVSASIGCSEGDVPDSAGTIVYDTSSRTVTYTFTSDYLKSIEYRGQTYTFTVVCRINETALGGQAFSNTAEVVINGEVVTTPAATVTVEIPNDRSVVLTKRIKAADIVFDHGYPTFLFRLEGTDASGDSRVYYRAVTFTPEYVESHTADDGYVSCTTVISGLVPGNYTATEEVTNRYALTSITQVTGGYGDGGKAVFDLNSAQQGSAVFTNDKYEQGGFSDASLVENIVN